MSRARIDFISRPYPGPISSKDLSDPKASYDLSLSTKASPLISTPQVRWPTGSASRQRSRERSHNSASLGSAGIEGSGRGRRSLRTPLGMKLPNLGLPLMKSRNAFYAVADKNDKRSHRKSKIARHGLAGGGVVLRT